MSTWRFMIVDDNHVNRMLLKMILESVGYKNTIEARDGSEAIKKLKSEHVDLIFMDIQMPVMNGIEATAYIRKEMNATLPIIAITAYDHIDPIANGFNALVHKPYNAEKINSMIDKFLK